MQLPQQLKDLDRPRRREMSPVELIAEHYLKGARLTERQEAYRELLEAANSLLAEGKSRRDVREMLINLHDVQKSSAYQVINDAIDLFGDIQKNTRQGLVQLQTQWYERMAAKLEDSNPELAIQCRQNIDRINGLHDKRGQTINIGKVLMPKQIIFTTDPAALALQREQQDAEEAEFEDAEEMEE
jgi:hypothetical protein